MFIRAKKSEKALVDSKPTVLEKLTSGLVFPVTLGAVVNSIVGAADAVAGIAASGALRVGLSVIAVLVGIVYQYQSKEND